jgi:hypothetical protein
MPGKDVAAPPDSSAGALGLAVLATPPSDHSGSLASGAAAARSAALCDDAVPRDCLAA